jgi:hypothetical protein
LAGPGTNSLTGSLNPKTGLFNLTFGDENGKGVTKGAGVFLQSVGPYGGGFFPGTTSAGAILLTNAAGTGH